MACRSPSLLAFIALLVEMYPNGEAWAAPDAVIESVALASAGRTASESLSGMGKIPPQILNYGLNT